MILEELVHFQGVVGAMQYIRLQTTGVDVDRGGILLLLLLVVIVMVLMVLVMVVMKSSICHAFSIVPVIRSGRRRSSNGVTPRAQTESISASTLLSWRSVGSIVGRLIV